MQKKILFILALLCAVAQGTWAQVSFPIVYDDVWDGVTTTRPTYYESYNGVKKVLVINKASELAYLRDHFEDKTYYDDNSHYYSQNYYLNANLDMGVKTWKPFPHITDDEDGGYMGTFYGNNHTIRINIKDAKDNYQGLFGRLWYGTVQDLHVTGNISCERSRFVGGIAGLGYSANVRNCWVSADISSQWREPSSAYTACVGGILGDFYHSRGSGEQVMEYCCMTGNVLNDDASVGGLVGWKEASTYVRHCTFYGTRYSVHDQHDVFFGKYVVN